MAVSAESVRSFLESASLMNNVSEDKLSRFLSLYERATKTTTVLTGMPGGGGSDREAVLANMADARSDADAWFSLVKDRKKLVNSFLEEVEVDDYYKEMLTQRYILCMPWVTIHYLLRGKKEISESTMYRDHNRALEACAAWVNSTGRYKEEMI